MSMTFYSVQIKESIDVPDDQVEVVTMKNGKKAARATVDREGKTLKLFKFLPAGDTPKAATTDAPKDAPKAAATDTPKAAAADTAGAGAKKTTKKTAGAGAKKA